MGASAFDRLSIYEQRITRNIERNMKLLVEMQARRKAEELIEAKAKPLTRTASSGDKENGFDFSIAFSKAEAVVEMSKGVESDVKKAA